MSDLIRRVDYFYTTVADKPGEAARILAALHQAGVNLLAFSGFPHGARRSQLDFVPEDSAAFSRAAKKAGVKLSTRKTGFLIQGQDRLGALADLIARLGNINVTAVSAVGAAEGRYGALLWVKQPDVRRAAKALLLP